MRPGTARRCEAPALRSVCPPRPIVNGGSRNAAALREAGWSGKQLRVA